jgi:acetyl-CoA acetyltransferase
MLTFEVAGIHIAGEWRLARDGRTFATVHPTTGRVLANVAEAGEDDGNAAVAAARDGLTPVPDPRSPDGTVVASAVADIEPAQMGIGPMPATRRSVRRAGLSASDLGPMELNEAFEAHAVACIREIGIGPDIVNVPGGPIALGHPLGCSGARILTTLLHAMRGAAARYGLATMCIGVGQGIAMIVENLDHRGQ